MAKLHAERLYKALGSTVSCEEMTGAVIGRCLRGNHQDAASGLRLFVYRLREHLLDCKLSWKEGPVLLRRDLLARDLRR